MYTTNTVFTHLERRKNAWKKAAGGKQAFKKHHQTTSSSSFSQYRITAVIAY